MDFQAEKTPYRTPAPQPPKPSIPFEEKHPRFYNGGKVVFTSLVGIVVGLGSVLGVLWCLGWCVNWCLKMVFADNDLPPVFAAGILGIEIFIIVTASGYGCYHLGKYVLDKIAKR